MALTERYVTADSDGGDGSAGNPWTLSEALASAAAGNRVNILSGNYPRTASDTVANAGTAGSPIIFRGVSSFDPLTPITPTRTNQGALDTTGMPVISYGATYVLIAGDSAKNYITLQGLNITGSRNGPILYVGRYSPAKSCSITNAASGNGVRGAELEYYSYLENCDVSVTNATQAQYAVYTAYSNITLINCRLRNSAATSSAVARFGGASVIIKNCTILPSSGIGIDLAGSNSFAQIHNSTITGQAIAAIRTPNAAMANLLVVADCILTDNGQALLNQYNATAAHPILWQNNRTRDNTSPDLGFGDWPYYSPITTDTGGPETDYKDAANGDLRLIRTSPAVSAGPLGGELGAIPRPKATLPTAAQVESGVTFGYAQDGLTTGTLAVGGGGAHGVIGSDIILGGRRAA